MNSLIEVKESIVNFYDLEEAKRNELVKSISNYAERTKEEELYKEIREHFEQKSESGIGIIYEALGDNPKKRGNFFKEEVIRAFETAENVSNPFEVLDALEEITMTDVNKIDCSKEVIKFLSKYLSSKNLVLRYKAVWNLGNWLTEANSSDNAEVIQMIKEKLNDENWKIRYITSLALKDLNKLPKDYQLSFGDKIKMKFSSPFEIGQ